MKRPDTSKHHCITAASRCVCLLSLKVNISKCLQKQLTSIDKTTHGKSKRNQRSMRKAKDQWGQTEVIYIVTIPQWKTVEHQNKDFGRRREIDFGTSPQPYHMDKAPDGAKLHEIKRHILEIYNNRLGRFYV